MTHLKKSLALLLALIMMFSSMSVAANAAGSTGTATTEDDITFTVKFFREKDGEWIETTKAAPNEKVKARVFVETGFYANTSDSCIVFDNQYLTPFKYNSAGNEEELQALVPNVLSANKSYGDVNYTMTGTFTWRGDDSTWQKNMDFLFNNIESDPNYFDTRDIITHTLAFPALAKNIKLTNSDWICEFDFKVKNNPLTNTVGSEGETKVPPYYASLDRTVTHPKFGEVSAELFINFPMGEEGGDLYSEQVSMKDWIPDFDTVPGTITTTSEIIFDLGLGLVDADGSYSEDNIYTIQRGIISKEADLESVTNPTHPDGKAFMYWSTTNPAAGETPEKVSTISYDYDAETLYAVWGEVPDVSYTLNEYYMNADGTYPSTVQGTQKNATPDSKVSAPESTDPLYTLDESKSDFEVVINADGSSVVNAYYERNKYNLVYHYEDMAGAQTDTYKVRFGADLPGFRTTKLEDGTVVEGEPTKTGYTFIGWTTVEGGTEAETRPLVMPAEDLHLYPVYTSGETYDFVYIFNAGEGTFSNGESIMRYEYKYLDPVETPEAPTALGKRFVDWDDEIPEVAAEDKTFEAIYEDELYTVTFKADTDEDGEYETTVSTLTEEFKYNSKLEAKYAPENYPADAWKLEDGTAVEISDAETAYTVTGNVVLYTVGNDEYPANFYWSQEDLDNGADPYKTIYVKFDTEIPAPEAPEKDGYNFVQWELDLEGQIMDTTEGKDFVAVFEAKDITVTYDPNGGACGVPSDEVKYEESVTLPEASRDGYEFKGWATPDDKIVGAAGDSYKVPTEDVALKAVWEAEEHTITFIDDDGKELGKITADTDEEITTPENLNPPVKEGHNFTGWTAAGVTGTVTVPSTMPADDMVLTATWEKLSYAINADANGGVFDNETDKLSAEIPFGDPLNVEQPDFAGHKFLGWAYADDESNTIITLPTEMPAKAINIKAVWDTNKHDVKYDANGGVFTNADGSTTSFREFKDVEYGGNIPVLIEQPTQEGYEFVRWTPESPDAMPDNDLIFKAEWEKIPEPEEADYEIYISYPNPANPEETLEKLVITDAALPGTAVSVVVNADDATTEKYHTYDEILAKVDVDGIEPDYSNIPESITVTENGGKIVVSFKLTEYTVEFSPNGGKFGTSEDSVIVKGTWGQTVEAPAQPTRKGYTFTGWNKDVPETFTQDVVISATWTIQKHNAIFVVVDENDNEVARIPVEYEFGDTVVAPDYEAPDGYEFNGWNILPGTIMGETDMTFTSKLDPITYELSYEISGLPADMTVTAPATQTGLRKGAEATVSKAPEVAGYIFDGWYNGEEKIAADGTGKIVMPEDDVVLTGTYTAKIVSYIFDANGGKFSNGASKFPVEGNAGTTVTVPVPSKEGCELTGWADAKGNPVANPGVIPEENTTIYAQWTTNKHTVTYDANGGVFAEGVQSVFTVEYGDKIPVPSENPKRDNFDFVRWSPAAPDAMPDSDLVFVAEWEETKPSEATYEIYAVTYNPANPTEKMEVLVATGSGTAGETVEILKDGEDKTADYAHTYAELVESLKSNSNEPNYDIRPEVTILGAGANKILVEFKLIEFVVTFNANGGVIYDENGEEKTEIVVKGYYGQPVNVPGDDALYLEGHDFTGWDENPADTFTENATYNATWTPGLYDVYFYIVNENGEEDLYAVESFEFGAPIEAPEYSVPEGFEFSGWDVEGKIMGADDEEFTATLTPIDYNLTYVISGLPADKGVAAPAEKTGLHAGQDVDVAAAPEVEGYTFDGWYDDNDEKYFDNGTDTINMPANDVILRGTYTANEYTITYVTDGAGDIPADTYDCDEVVSTLPAVSKEGFGFLGWYDGETKVEAGFKMPARDITLTAKWGEDIKYSTITLDANGGVFENGAPVYSVSSKVGDQFNEVPKNPTRDGFEFIGWMGENGEATSIPEVFPEKDVTIKADWAELYDVTYYDEDGETVIKSFVDAGKEGADIPTIDDPFKEGYEFVGWNGMPEDGKIPAGNLELTAVWTPVEVPEHKIEYFYGDPGVLHETRYFKEGEPVDHPEGPSIEGLTFTGWADENGNDLPAVMGNTDLKAYAQYKFNTYKVTYIVDGGVYQEYEVLYQAEVPVPADPAGSETRSFAGWSPVPEATMPAHDLTYTATWVGIAEPDQYTATFLRHDGETHAKYVLEEGDVIPVPVAPQRFGYVFVGWEPEVPDTMPANDMVFEPKYEIDKTFVTIVVGGTVVAGGVIAGSIIGANIAAITGISIVGGVIVIAGVAELIKHTHTVTYLVDGEVYKSYKVVEGTKIPVPADPTKDGFTFEGWNPEVPEKMGKEDLVFEATWAEVGAADDSTLDVDVEIPETGSVAGGLTAFAVISGAAAAAYVFTRRKKED